MQKYWAAMDMDLDLDLDLALNLSRRKTTTHIDGLNRCTLMANDDHHYLNRHYRFISSFDAKATLRL